MKQEEGIRAAQGRGGLGDVYRRQGEDLIKPRHDSPGVYERNDQASRLIAGCGKDFQVNGLEWWRDDI